MAKRRLPINDFLLACKEVFVEASLKTVRSKPLYNQRVTNMKVHLINTYNFETHKLYVFISKDQKNFDEKFTLTKAYSIKDLIKLIQAMKIYSFVTKKLVCDNHEDLICSCYNFLKEKVCAHVFHVLKDDELLSLIEMPLTDPKKRGRPRRESNNVDASYFN